MEDETTIVTGLLAAMHHSTEPMALADPHLPDMPIVAVNAAFEALSGYPTDEILGRNCRFLQGPETDRDTIRKMSACLRDGHGCIQWLLNYRKDGSLFWNLLFISPVYAQDGTLLYFFSNQHDLSAEQPLGLEHFTLGTAHMALTEEAVFHDLLHEMGRHAKETAASEKARALEATLAGARQVAYLSTRLQSGPRA
jgi:PAS domain S-box-containing protein